MLEIEKSFLYFKTTRYKLSLVTLEKVKKYLRDEHGSSKQWIIKTIDKFIDSVRSTFEHRKKLFNTTPKFKKWTVKPYQKQAGSKVNFKLEGFKENWNVDYEQDQ